ncbi:MAG: succinate dehydrogenase, hydrophobic membrane anchor protein [Pseudomonadota bacterium]
MSSSGPLSKIMSFVTAGEAVQHWSHQRLTAIALIPLVLWLVISLLSQFAAPYESVVSWISSPVVTVLFIVLFVVMFYHAKLGLQVVIEDYIHTDKTKVAVLLFTKFATIAGAIAGVGAVLTISLGAP